MARRLKPEGQWGDQHRSDLMRGADAHWNKFGEPRVASRRRDGTASDFTSDTMGLARIAWDALRDDLLSEVDDPADVWAYRKFVLGERDQ